MLTGLLLGYFQLGEFAPIAIVIPRLKIWEVLDSHALAKDRKGAELTL